MKLLTSLLLAFALAPQTPTQPPPSPRHQPQVQTPPPAQAPPGVKPELGRRPPLAARYTIGPQDQLKITVFDEADLTGKYRVDADGFVTFPMVGRVPASGLTLSELQDRLTTMLAAGYIRNPQVRIEIDQYKSQSVLRERRGAHARQDHDDRDDDAARSARAGGLADVEREQRADDRARAPRGRSPAARRRRPSRSPTRSSR